MLLIPWTIVASAAGSIYFVIRWASSSKRAKRDFRKDHPGSIVRRVKRTRPEYDERKRFKK